MKKEASGLTLIELLITIAVIAIVAAITVPIVINVVQSSNESSLKQMNVEVDNFIERYIRGGAILFYSANTSALGLTLDANTIYAFVDLNGDGAITGDELVESLKVKQKFILVNSSGNTFDAIQPIEFKYPKTSATSISPTDVDVEFRENQ